jgi:hypothetical protein
LIEIRADFQIKLTLKPGAVYNFPEPSFSSSEPHYFVVLNHNPLSDKFLALVCGSSRIEKVKRRRHNCPLSTLVEISPAQYSGFPRHTIIDCNEVHEYTTGNLINKVEKGDLKLKPVLDSELIVALRSAVCDSPLVPIKIKKLLRGNNT